MVHTRIEKAERGRREDKLSLAELIERAGGIAKVSLGTGLSVEAVLSWRRGTRVPAKGPLRHRLCALAKCELDEVRWERGQ